MPFSEGKLRLNVLSTSGLAAGGLQVDLWVAVHERRRQSVPYLAPCPRRSVRVKVIDFWLLPVLQRSSPAADGQCHSLAVVHRPPEEHRAPMLWEAPEVSH